MLVIIELGKGIWNARVKIEIQSDAAVDDVEISPIDKKPHLRHCFLIFFRLAIATDSCRAPDIANP